MDPEGTSGARPQGGPAPAEMEHFFRREAGRIVSLLTRIFGLRHLQLAEDVVQEALLAAFNEWSFGAIPENPSAWIMTVAKRKALNRLKRDGFLERHARDIELSLPTPDDLEASFRENEVEDSMLRMFFVCCHPSLPAEARLILTLKILCGFSVREISGALLSTESAVEKRLQRAKEEFRTGKLPLEIPDGESLEARLKSVHTCIYLLFNEGYNSSHPDFLIRKDVCAEAMRLCRLLLDRFPEHRPSFALMALMCFHAARFDSRIDDKGALVIFSLQDRSKWNRALIQMGHTRLAEAAQGESLSEYHLEAAIAAEHCSAADFASTRWDAIDRYYAALAEIKDNPVIELNRAIILSQTEGPEPALRKLLALRDHPRLKGYYLLHATLGELYERLGNPAAARECRLAASALTRSKAELAFLRGKLEGN
jgi:RNA polymerase sigma factor (sigma-70 family)